MFRSLILSHSYVSRQIEDAAEWLLKLHKCGVKSGRRYTFGRHLETLAKQKYRTTQTYPESESRLAALLCQIQERGHELSGWTPGPTHRDFSPDHILVDGDELTALDFDEFCQDDPLFDAAHFTAHLRFLGLTYFGPLTHFDWLAQRFRAAYQAGAHDYSAPRMNLYDAIAYFKLAHIAAVVRLPPTWQDVVAALLAEAQQFV